MWYLDLYISCHLTNNRDLFIDKLQTKSLEFSIGGGQTLQAESVGTITIPLIDGSSIKLKGVAYTPKCNLNLIFLGQLRDNNVAYIDNIYAMTLMQGGREIIYVRHD